MKRDVSPLSRLARSLTVFSASMMSLWQIACPALPLSLTSSVLTSAPLAMISAGSTAVAAALVLNSGTAEASGGEAVRVNGWEALAKLQAGNKRFLSGDITWLPDPDQRKVLAGGQHPFAIILSCSDSRVAPELLFDQGLGDLFVVRVAGNVADPHAIASIEYALEHLGARLLVVMGHESCGAVKAALTTPRGSSAGTPSLDVLVRGIQRNLDGNTLFNTNDKTLVAPVKANVSSVARQLVNTSPVIHHLLESKELVVAQAVYGLESGDVTFFYAGVPEVEAHVRTYGGGHETSADHGGGATGHTAAKKKHKSKSKHRTSSKARSSHGGSSHGASAAGGHGASTAGAHGSAPSTAPSAVPVSARPSPTAAPSAPSATYVPPSASVPQAAPAAAPAHSSGH